MMKRTPVHTMAGFGLGVVIAVGGAALAATPANAATSVTIPHSALNSSVTYDPGQPWYDAIRYNFDSPVSRVSYTVTGEGAGVQFTDEFAEVLGYQWDANDQFLWAGSATGGLYRFTRVSDTSIRVDIDYGAAPMDFAVLYMLEQVNTSPTAQVRYTWDILSLTPADTGVPEDVVDEPQATRTVTWSENADGPVIAPAIASIALLGSAGIGGGVALGRRRRRRA
jgi:hypothetical protein